MLLAIGFAITVAIGTMSSSSKQERYMLEHENIFGRREARNTINFCCVNVNAMYAKPKFWEFL
jgi:hypothetical protein